MKLIIMIPCLNEEDTLPQVLSSMPRRIDGVTDIETLIVDDGSTDDTINVARRHGVTHVLRMRHNMGLARAFQAGIDACLDLGADIIVNTDGDNQYPSEAIPALIEPVVHQRADITIGDRQTGTITEFSGTKKLLQRLGSWMVRRLSGVLDVPDAVSGFRAYSRFAASRVYLTSTYSYTIESIIQAGKRGMRIESVPISTNPKTRPSRLYKHLLGFLARSGTTLLRSYALYEPLRIFLLVGSAAFAGGVGVGARYLYFLAQGEGQGHVQSLILAASLLLGGLTIAVGGLLADLLAANRRLLEELVWREKSARHGLLESTHGSGIRQIEPTAFEEPAVAEEIPAGPAR